MVSDQSGGSVSLSFLRNNLKLDDLYNSTQLDQIKSCINILHEDIPPKEFKFTLLKVLEKKTAPGPDLLTYNILSHLPTNVFCIIRNIFNLLLRQGKFPDAWKKYYMVFIYT